MLLVLFFLIIRVVSFEWRSKSETPGWRAFWTWCNTIGSAGAALIWGVGLSCLVYGVPINSGGDYAGDFWDLFSPYTVFAGVAVVVLFAFHGATFLTLRTVGELRDRAENAARRLALPAVVLAAVFLIWTVVVAMDNNDKDLFPPVLPAALGIVALGLALIFLFRGANGRAFAMTGLGAISVVATLFVSLYPARDGLELGLRKQPHGRRRVLVALRAPGHERRGADLRPARAPLPGLDVLRVPAAGRRRDARPAACRGPVGRCVTAS